MTLLRASALACLAASAACLWLSRSAAQQPPVASAPALQQVIDREIQAACAKQGLSPGAPGSEEEFLRRVYLDVVGLPPTQAEALVFLDDRAEGKRAALVDKLLADPRFGEHLADLWLPILRQRGNDLGELGVSAGDVLAVWLARQFNEDVPFNATITALVTAEGPISENPASAYYALMGFPAPVADVAGLTLKNFAGMQMQCAQCHDHPYETAWTQRVFAGMAAFFSPIEVKADFYRQPIDPALASKDLPARALVEAYGKTPGLPVEAINRVADLLAYDKPQLIGDTALKTRDGQSWRRMMASWLTSPKNRTAMHYQVNRFWGFLFGIGLVNPVDDFNGLNTPSHPALLNALADDWARDFNVKRLYRAILNSGTWQRSSKGADPKAQGWHFAASRARPLTPEQFFGALFGMVEGDGFVKSFARQTQNAYQKLAQVSALVEQQKKSGAEPANVPRINSEALDRYLKQLEAMGPLWQIRRGLAAQYAQLASDDKRAQTDGLTGSIDQALAVLNGEVTRRIGGSLNGSLVFALMRDFKETPQRIEAMYLSVLSRRPTEAESLSARKLIEQATNANEGLEDLFFALISTTEFGTNH